ncbi:MAG: hypothetical protein AMJ63_07390 [Myxococcales bacterium SG8_38_1]|jgi:hypothetical protein|nr:MAG: hypothetical protein AMJ63_07390 [Myxococcales bacterium SG8_38_1]
MSGKAPSEGHIQVIRLVCFFFAASSFVLGGWMMLDPASAWGSMGIEVASDPVAPAIYGGAIMGEGAMFALGAIWPVRYLVFLQYLVLYKTFACIAGAAVLLRMEPAPMGGWFVIAGWAFAGITAALIFPWKQWSSVEDWYGLRSKP